MKGTLLCDPDGHETLLYLIARVLIATENVTSTPFTSIRLFFLYIKKSILEIIIFKNSINILIILFKTLILSLDDYTPQWSNFIILTEGGFRPFESKLIIRLTTRTKSSHATPVISFYRMYIFRILFKEW